MGRIDAVVNNAGILTQDEFPDTPPSTLMRHLSVHVGGSYNVTRAAWPYMARVGYGRVVLTTSSGMFGSAGLIGYSTAKGALVSLGRSLAEAGARTGIKVNLLAPAAETRMVTDPDVRRRAGLPLLAPETASNEASTTAEVSPTVALLAHEACPVNGEIISVGKGRLARIYLAETAGIVRPGLRPEEILDLWPVIADGTDYFVPTSTHDYVDHREKHIRDAADG